MLLLQQSLLEAPDNALKYTVARHPNPRFELGNSMFIRITDSSVILFPMGPFWLSLVWVAQGIWAWQPFDAQFTGSTVGESVSISIDGQRPHTTFAGKLSFRDNSGTWISVCADVRSPVVQGHISQMKPADTMKVGGRFASAGHIIAHCFQRAQSPDECAALQLAIWKTLEDGAENTDFQVGHFRAAASNAIISLAVAMMATAKLDKDTSSAVVLAAATGQSQLTISRTSNTDK
jgi:hypothetical protein